MIRLARTDGRSAVKVIFTIPTVIDLTGTP